MIEFQAIIEKFEQKGEKTGWTYIEIPQDKAEQLLPGNKKSFRVQGKLDHYEFKWVALIPMGEGNFIMPLNATIRKEIKKPLGAMLMVQMEADTKEPPLSLELMQCLEDEPAAFDFFNALPKGHQRYFSNWIESAKTDLTKAKRISQSVMALANSLGYAEMLRMNKKSLKI